MQPFRALAPILKHAKLVLVLILLTLFAAGCGQRSSPEYLMDEYLVRVSRVIRLELPSNSSTVHLPQLPPLSQRTYPLSDVRIKALDALDLLKCPALSQTVAHRNSSLGKQMLPSQLLHYEKRLFNHLSDCIQYLEESDQKPETVNLLREVMIEKARQLPSVRWNALFSNTELTQQLRGNGKLLPLTGDHGRQGSLEALNYLVRYLPVNSLESPYTRPELEQQLQQLQASRYSGQLLFSVQQLTLTLNQASWLLETSLAKQPVCPQGKAGPTIQRLQNVFRLFYAGSDGIGIQPFLARLHKQGAEWRGAMASVMSQLPPPPNREMHEYLSLILSENHPQSLWQLLEQATSRHTRAWQKLLGQCGLMPGSERQSVARIQN